MSDIYLYICDGQYSTVPISGWLRIVDVGIPTSLVTFTQQSEMPDTGTSMQQRYAVRSSRVLFTHWLIVYFADLLLIGSDKVG